MTSSEQPSKQKLSTWALILADLDRYRVTEHHGYLSALLLSPGSCAGVVYRIGHWIWTLSGSWAALMPLLKVLYYPLMRWTEITSGISISPNATFGPGLYIGHFGNIRVGGDTVIGSNCNLSQGVTLGGIYHGPKAGHATIGDRVYIAPGAKVIGNITVGDDAAIGANSVVGRDVLARGVVIGVPARAVPGEGSFNNIAYRGMETDPERLASMAMLHANKTKPDSEKEQDV